MDLLDPAWTPGSVQKIMAQDGDSEFHRAMAAESAGQRVPPLFSAPPGTSEKISINLDDIFADCFFTQEDVSLLEGGQQRKAQPAPAPETKGFPTTMPPVQQKPQRAPEKKPVQPPEWDDDDDERLDDDSLDAVDDAGDLKPKTKAPAAAKSKRSRTSAREMTEQQKDERRERNREHAKRSRVRKKFLLESLQQSVNALQYENDKLRVAIREKMGDDVAGELLANVGKDVAGADATKSGASLIAKSPGDATRILDDPDYSLVKALQTAQQNFVITDPSLPDNPIVFASQGFLNLTGYSLDNVLGRNCRFLQGPRTDPRAVAKIRKAVEDGYDTSVCLLNYRIDGSTFYNQFFVAPLRDGDGNVVNYVGVQCQVSDAFAQAIARDEQLPPV